MYRGNYDRISNSLAGIISSFSDRNSQIAPGFLQVDFHLLMIRRDENKLVVVT